jgi:NAD(P)-dependent dehydrogenase (short-subunit alcohol dehydrogenase family)
VRNHSHLILAVRSPSKGGLARTKLLEAHHTATIGVWNLDHDSYSSITAFVERCKTELPRIDFAILNAGIVKMIFELNPQTHSETTVQVNWLSMALLAMLLFPVLEASSSPAPRLTIVSSETREWAAFKERNMMPILKALNEEENFKLRDRYYTTKLLMVYFFREFVARAGETRVVINTVNPGFCCESGLHREVPGAQGAVLGGVKRVIGRSTWIGARTLVDGAVMQGRESHGRYLEDCKAKPSVVTFRSMT